MKKINYGIIGCGKHALRLHALLVKKSNFLNLVTLCDLSSVNMDKFIKEYGRETELTQYTSEDKILASNIDAVLIGTPDEFHAKTALKAVKAGKHIFVEKPLATNIDDLKLVKEAIKLAKEKKLVFTSCHPRRYDKPYLWLKDNIQKFTDELGPVISFDFDFSYFKPVKQWKFERGLLIDHISHEIDILHFLFSYENFRATKLIDSFDRYHTIGIRDDGISFSFSGTRRLDGDKCYESVTIRFEKGELIMTPSHDNGKVIVKNHKNRAEKIFSADQTDNNIRYLLTTENFGKAILGEEKNYLTDLDLYVNTTMSVVLTYQDNYQFLISDYYELRKI